MTYRWIQPPESKPHQGGHYSDGGYPYGHYKMCSSWIDTDNQCWEEPYHLYGDFNDEIVLLNLRNSC